MHIDYSEMFTTSDRLADFCMLPVEEQSRLEAEYLQATSKNVEMACDISKRNQS